MGAEPPRPSWGAGRIAFLAILEPIRAELHQGHSLTRIFARHQARLGISYASFCRLVSRYAEDAKLAHTYPPPPPSRPASFQPAHSPQTRVPHTQPPPPSLSAPATQGSYDAGHQPARRTFNHDPLEHPDDRRRLLGED
jgi:hypothetical protein